MRNLKLFVPADCIVSNTPADNEHALRLLQVVLNSDVAVSTELTFRKRGRGPKGGRS